MSVYAFLLQNKLSPNLVAQLAFNPSWGFSRLSARAAGIWRLDWSSKVAELGFEPVPLPSKPTHHCMCCLSAYVFLPPNVNCLILRMWIVCSLLVSNSDKIYSCSEGILTLIDTTLHRFLSPYKFASNYKGPFLSLRHSAIYFLNWFLKSYLALPYITASPLGVFNSPRRWGHLFCGPHQRGAGECLTTSSSRGKTLVHSVCQCPWCKYSHGGQFWAATCRFEMYIIASPKLALGY